MANCTICSKPEATFSLPLKREARKWQTAPICKECRWALIKGAKGEGKFIRIYDLESSVKESERRNLEDDRLSTILKAYAVTSRKDEAVNRYLKLASKG